MLRVLLRLLRGRLDEELAVGDAATTTVGVGGNEGRDEVRLVVVVVVVVVIILASCEGCAKVFINAARSNSVWDVGFDHTGKPEASNAVSVRACICI